MAKSSACSLFLTFGPVADTISLMKMRKSVGEIALPCGTSSLRLTFLLYTPSIFTLAVRFSRKLLIHLYMFPAMPLLANFRRSPSFHTVSKAFVMSKTQLLFSSPPGIHFQFSVQSMLAGSLCFCFSGSLSVCH